MGNSASARDHGPPSGDGEPNPTARPERRLTAILAADVAGYSSLMEADERGTLERLKSHRKAFVEPLVAEHRGRIVKLTGDGALCEFASAVDAVECAIRIQRGVAEREAEVAEERKIRFRIGVNLGDVIREADGDLYGDGVNIAARLEGIAEPGGICISRTVHDYIRGKVPVAFRPLGRRRVKNISEPIEVYRVDLAGAPARRPQTAARRAFAAAFAGLVLALSAGGWWLWATAGGGSASSAGKPSIAVLAFDNLSGDPAQAYFSEGIAEEILIALARSPHLTVIARNSSFAYKDKVVDVKQVGHELGVRYLLEGSVKREGDRVRVSAQLVDARTGGHVWAERYDRVLGDIFAVQDEVTAAIAARLGATIERAEADLARRKAPADLGAYDLYLQGRAKSLTHARAPQLEARELFRKAIEIDSAFAPAHAELARTYYTEVALRWDPPRRAEALSKGLELAREAVALDPTLPVAHLTMGNLLLRAHDYDAAAAWAGRAIELNPNDPENHAALANIYTFMGRAREALPLMHKAFELDPNYPPVYDMYAGRAYLAARQPAAAVPHLRNAASRAPDHWPAHLFLAAAYGHLRQMDEAAAALAAARRLISLNSVRDYASGADWRPGPERDYVLEGMALAGLPRE